MKERIQKRKARSLFNKGRTVYLVPSKLNPESPFVGYIGVNKDRSGDFDKAVNAFEYYNCTNETGRYAHFYTDNEVREGVSR